MPHIKVLLYRNPILEKLVSLLNKKTNTSLNEEIQRSKSSHTEVENKASLEELQPDVIENFESVFRSQNRLNSSLNSSEDLESPKEKTMYSSRNVDLDAHNSSVGELELLLFESSAIKLEEEEYKEFLLDNDDTLSKFDNDLEELEIVTVDDIPSSIEITRELEEPLFEGFESVRTEKLKLINAAMKFVAETPSSDTICKSLIQTLNRISDTPIDHSMFANRISEMKDHFLSASHIGDGKDHSIAADFTLNVPLSENKGIDVGDEICVKGDVSQLCLLENASSVSSYDELSTATHQNYNLRRKSRSVFKKKHIKIEDKENINIINKQKKRSLSDEDSSQSGKRKIQIRNQENEDDVFSKLNKMSDKNHYKNKIRTLRKNRRKSRLNSLTNERYDCLNNVYKRSLRKKFRVNYSESSVQEEKGFNLCRRSLRKRFKNAEFESSIKGQDSKEEPHQFTWNSLGNEIKGAQDYSTKTIESLQSNHSTVKRILKRKFKSLSAESSSMSLRKDSVAADGYSRKRLKEDNIFKEIQRMKEEICAKETKGLHVRVTGKSKLNYKTSFKERNFMKQNNIVEINYGLYSLKHVVSVEENEIINNYFFAKTSAEDLYKCYFCKYSSMDQEMVFKHLGSHKINDVFWCVHCSFKAKYLSTLIKHSGAHAEDKLFSCSECIYKACSLYRIRNHKSVHTGFPPYNCNLCKFTCMSRTNIKTHIHKHKMNRLKRLKNTVRILNCPCCSETFNGSRTFSNHIKTHFAHDIFRCSYCLFESCQFLDFREHILSHKEDENKIFKCQYCNIKVKSALNIIYHLKSHAGMFPCYACFNVFHKTIDLNEHKCVSQYDKNYSDQDRSTTNIDTHKFYGKQSLSSGRESSTLGDNRFVNSEFGSTTSYAARRVCEERLSTLKGFKHKKKQSFKPSCFLKSEITERGLRIFNSQKVQPKKEDQKIENKSLEETKLQTSNIAEVGNHLDSSKQFNFSVEDTQISSLKPVDKEGVNTVNMSNLHFKFKICGDTVMNIKENCQNILSNHQKFTKLCSHFDKVKQNTGKEALSESNEIEEFMSKDINENNVKRDGVTEQSNTSPCKTLKAENIDQVQFNEDSSCKIENSTEIESNALKNGMMDPSKNSTCNNVNEGPQNGNNVNEGPQNGNNANEGPQNGNNVNEGPQNGNNANEGPQNGNNINEGPQNGNNANKGPQNGNNVNEGPQNGNNVNEGPQNGNNANEGPQNANKGPQNGNNVNEGPQNGNNVNEGPQNGNNVNEGPQNGNNANKGPKNGNVNEGPQNGNNANEGPQNANKGPQNGNNVNEGPQNGNNANEGPQNGTRVAEMAKRSKKLCLNVLPSLKDLSTEISNKEKSSKASLLKNEALIDLTKENVDDEILVLRREPCLKYFNKKHLRKEGHLNTSGNIVKPLNMNLRERNICERKGITSFNHESVMYITNKVMRNFCERKRITSFNHERAMYITNKDICDENCSRNGQNSLGNVKVNHNDSCKVVLHSVKNDEINDLTNTKNISKCFKFKICSGEIVNSFQHNCDRVLPACHTSFNNLEHPCENGYILHNRIVQCGSNISHLTFKIFDKKILSYVVDYKQKSKFEADLKTNGYGNTFSNTNDSTVSNNIVKNLESLNGVEYKSKLKSLGIKNARAVNESGEFSNNTRCVDAQEGVAATFDHNSDQKDNFSHAKSDQNFSKNCKEQNVLVKNSTPLKSKEQKFVTETSLQIPKAKQSSMENAFSNSEDINKSFSEIVFVKNSKVQNSLIDSKNPKEQNKYSSENDSLQNFSENKPLKVKSPRNIEQIKSTIDESPSEITKDLDKAKLKTPSKKGKELNTIFIDDFISEKGNGQNENLLDESSLLNLKGPKNAIEDPSSKKCLLGFSEMKFKVPTKSLVESSSVNSKEKISLKESSLENLKEQNSSLTESSVNSKENVATIESPLVNSEEHKSLLKLKEQDMSIVENCSLEQPSFVAGENHENKIDTLCTGDAGVKENESEKQNVESEVPRRECFYECKYCDFGADKLFKLNIHLMKHSDLNPFECSFCPLTFSKPKLLKAHMKTHAYKDQT